MIYKENLGLYWVGNRAFSDKVQALKFASKTKAPVQWEFCPTVFDKIDWSIPIETSLPDLYRLRALQIREKYDYVSLFFSGGVDSGNILRTFVDNNILLDEVVMFLPKSFKPNKNDLSADNGWSEIEFAAIPFIKSLNMDSRTKIRIIDTETAASSFVSINDSRDGYASQTSLSLYSFIRLAVSTQDSIWNSMYASGKTICHLQGIDKPNLTVEHGRYFFRFFDYINKSPESTGRSDLSEMIDKYAVHEPFYWTPDFPEIVIKQCQVLKEKCENDLLLKLSLVHGATVSNDLTRWINYAIYDKNVTVLNSMFQTEKFKWASNGQPNNWFFNSGNDTVIGSYADFLKDVTTNISDEHFAGRDGPYGTDKNVVSRSSYRFFQSQRYYL